MNMDSDMGMRMDTHMDMDMDMDSYAAIQRDSVGTRNGKFECTQKNHGVPMGKVCV